MGARGTKIVAGDPDELREAPVACLQDDLERLVALVQDLQRRDAVGLVEVQFVHLESFQAPVQATQGPVPFGLGGLACQEEALADGLQVRAQGPLRRSVSGGDVQVIDAGVQGLVEKTLGLLRRVHGERRATQDGDAGIVVGSAEASGLHVVDRSNATTRGLPIGWTRDWIWTLRTNDRPGQLHRSSDSHGSVRFSRVAWPAVVASVGQESLDES